MPLSTPVIVFRLMAAMLLVALAEFCVYGFLASLEPGDHLPFRIAYPLLGLLFFAAAMWLGFGAFRLQRVVLMRGIVGLILGGSVVFGLCFIIFMMGPRWEFLGVRAGAAYGVMAAPIGAAIGGALGVWIGSWRPNGRADGSAK